MIEVRALAKRFRLGKDAKKKREAVVETRDPREEGDWFWAVRDVSFQCRPGEVLGLLGPNGAGKTTTLRMLSTALAPDRGEVLIDGVDVSRTPVVARQQLGFLSGATGLYGRLTVRENIRYFGRLHRVTDSELEERVETLLDELDMRSYADKRADQLSTGMKQKCAIARTVIHQPKIVVLDEPTTGLDVMAAKSLLEFIQRYKELRIPLIFSTHHLHEVEKLCDEVCVINHGRTVFSGTVPAFREQGGGTDLYDAFVNAVSREQ